MYLFQPIKSRESIKDNIFTQIPEEKQFAELNFESLSYVMNELKEAGKDENSVIIMDDMTASLKNSDVKKLLKKLICIVAFSLHVRRTRASRRT